MVDGQAYLIARIEDNQDKGMTRDSAIKEAVIHCIDNGILADFLKKNFKEVCDMLTWEIDAEKVKEHDKKAHIEEGIEIGIEKGIEKGRAETLLESAIKFVKRGFSINEVADTLGLDESQISQLKQMGV